MIHRVLCYQCAEPIEQPVDLEFRSAANGYPRDAVTTVLVTHHAGCWEPRGYVVPFGDILADGTERWVRHLSLKLWFGARSVDRFREVAGFMLRMRALRHVGAPARRDPIGPGLRARVMERDAFRCRRCGCGPERFPLEVDHVLPVSRGGLTRLDNLQTLCEVCNAGKRDRLPTVHDVLVAGGVR